MLTGFESFCAMITGTQMNIPTAHVGSGDYTEGGALDDSVRHAMTKLAHLHFTTNEQAADRVRSLGEEPWRVFNVGFPALDLVAAGNYATPEAIMQDLALDIERPIILFCQHSVTTEFEESARQVRPALDALAELAAEGCQIIITYPNNDAGGQRIVEEIKKLEAKGLPNVQVTKSLGRYRFHGVLNLIGRHGRGAYIGNSSAGIKETLMFGCPAINIGSRQQGRLRGDNVIDVPYEKQAILNAMHKCAEDETFRRQCATAVNPYGAGNAGPRIADILATIPINAALLQKKMTY